MKAIAISVNGKHIGAAGVNQNGLLDARVRWAGLGGGVRDYHMIVAAIEHETHQPIRSFRRICWRLVSAMKSRSES